jgi:hypothetical protein
MPTVPKVELPKPDALRKIAADRRVQVVAGVALIGLGLGLALGLKLRGPQRWVPPVDQTPTPCPDCTARARAVARVAAQPSTPIAPDVVTVPAQPAGTPMPKPASGPPIGPQVIDNPTVFSGYTETGVND